MKHSNKILFFFIGIVFLFSIEHLAFAATPNANTYPFTSINDTNRFESLAKEIRCVVCQNQSLAESNAPLANDLRKKIYHMILTKESDTQIKNYLIQRYGDFILLRPRLKQTTLLLWFFPLIGIASILFFFYGFFKKNNFLPDKSSH